VATFTQVTYTVTASTGSGGSISPKSASVQSGKTTQFTVAPNPGYGIFNVIGCNGLLSGAAYTTGPITANCTITATFTPMQTMSPQAATGDWYDPAHDGSGFNITLTSHGVILYYYGWDKSGNRLWLVSDIGPTQITSGVPFTVNMNQTSGGHFLTPANPATTVSKWGTLSMSFSADGATATATLSGKDGNVTFKLQKIVGLASASLITGDWYDPAYNGSGFNMLVSSSGLILYYYGWDSHGNRLWLVSDLGPTQITPGTSIRVNMNQTNGGVFSMPALPGTSTVWGTLQLDFSSCTKATGALAGNDGSTVTFNNLLMIVGVNIPPGC
jgi:hypothetical protein